MTLRILLSSCWCPGSSLFLLKLIWMVDYICLFFWKSIMHALFVSYCNDFLFSSMQKEFHLSFRLLVSCSLSFSLIILIHSMICFFYSFRASCHGVSCLHFFPYFSHNNNNLILLRLNWSLHSYFVLFIIFFLFFFFFSFHSMFIGQKI